MIKLICTLVLLLTSKSITASLIIDRPAWEENLLNSELSSCIENTFSIEELRQIYEENKIFLNSAQCFSTKVFFCEIYQGQIFIDGVSSLEERCPLSRLLNNINKNYPLPSCSFFYTRNGENIDRYPCLKNVPVLVGSKFLKSDSLQITFIEECSTLTPTGPTQESEWSLFLMNNEVDSCLEKYPWESKYKKLFWRGFLSDRTHVFHYLISNNFYEISPRVFLCILSFYNDLIDARITNINKNELDLLSSPYFCEVLGFNKLYDNGLYGSLSFNQRESVDEHLKYKYQIALDGVHATNPGYAWRLKSGCLVFKQDSPYFQWFYAGIKKDEHYVLVRRDLLDLMDKLNFFIENDDISYRIACNSREFANKYLNLDSFYQHAYLVLDAYHKLQSNM